MVLKDDEKADIAAAVKLRADVDQLRRDHDALKSNITKGIWTIGGAILLQLTDAVPKLLSMVGK